MAHIDKRTSTNGKISYRVRIRLKGFPLESATFGKKSKATEWAARTECAMHEGRYFKNSEAKRHTLGDLIDRYIRDVLPKKPKAERNQLIQLKWWKKKIGKYFLADLNAGIIALQRDALSIEKTMGGRMRSPSTVVRYMAALSHVFTIAIKEWEWLDSSPMIKVSKPKEPRGRIRFLDNKERQLLLQFCQESECPYLYIIVILALATGMRQGEIMNLSWSDVDFKEKKITLKNTKNGETRAVPLVGYAWDIIHNHAQFKKTNTSLIFPSKNPQKPISLRHYWCLALSKASIKDFRFHDLRHSAASYLAMNKATLTEIADILGHKTLQMVKRYTHLSESHTRGVISRMNKSIFSNFKPLKIETVEKEKTSKNSIDEVCSLARKIEQIWTTTFLTTVH